MTNAHAAVPPTAARASDSCPSPTPERIATLTTLTTLTTQTKWPARPTRSTQPTRARWLTCLHLTLIGWVSGCWQADWTTWLPPPEGADPSGGARQLPTSAGEPNQPNTCVPRPAATPAQRCSDASESSSLPPCEQWIKVQPEGATCSDGSPYKFFVNYANQSDNLLVMFEPGGACFDYDSCTRGKLGAVNPDGIPDQHMERYAALNLLRRTDDNPARDWNLVFVSYCTGDVHGGDYVANYPDPAGGPDLVYRHVGARNTRKVIEFLTQQFSDVPQLLVTGCSAGGTGATQNYALIREALPGAQCAYLLDDSGPIFSSHGPSQTLHRNSRAAWNLDPLLSQLEQVLRLQPGELVRDFGRINTALAQRFPRDRFAVAAYQRDLNYSLYSYAVFTPDISLEEIQANWQLDLQDLKGLYEQQPNMGYFLPYFRVDNCSHCATIPPLSHDEQTIQTEPWLGSEIAADGVDLRDFIDGLLDNSTSVERHFEQQASGDFTSEQAAMCLPQPSTDAP